MNNNINCNIFCWEWNKPTTIFEKNRDPNLTNSFLNRNASFVDTTWNSFKGKPFWDKILSIIYWNKDEPEILNDDYDYIDDNIVVYIPKETPLNIVDFVMLKNKRSYIEENKKELLKKLYLSLPSIYLYNYTNKSLFWDFSNFYYNWYINDDDIKFEIEKTLKKQSREMLEYLFHIWDSNKFNLNDNKKIILWWWIKNDVFVQMNINKIKFNNWETPDDYVKLTEWKDLVWEYYLKLINQLEPFLEKIYTEKESKKNNKSTTWLK